MSIGIVKILAVVGLAITLNSCGDAKDAVRDAGKSLEKSTENVKSGAEALSEGMKGIDLAGIKDLLISA